MNYDMPRHLALNLVNLRSSHTILLAESNKMCYSELCVYKLYVKLSLTENDAISVLQVVRLKVQKLVTLLNLLQHGINIHTDFGLLYTTAVTLGLQVYMVAYC